MCTNKSAKDRTHKQWHKLRFALQICSTESVLPLDCIRSSGNFAKAHRRRASAQTTKFDYFACCFRWSTCLPALSAAAALLVCFMIAFAFVVVVVVVAVSAVVIASLACCLQWNLRKRDIGAPAKLTIALRIAICMFSCVGRERKVAATKIS